MARDSTKRSEQSPTLILPFDGREHAFGAVGVRSRVTGVLIAGSHGQVGQRITDLLGESGHGVRAMIRDESRTPEMEAFGVERVVADLREDVSHAVRV